MVDIITDIVSCQQATMITNDVSFAAINNEKPSCTAERGYALALVCVIMQSIHSHQKSISWNNMLSQYMYKFSSANEKHTPGFKCLFMAGPKVHLFRISLSFELYLFVRQCKD